MTTRRTLLILRHAKSDWHAGSGDDFSRPLSARGKRDAPRVAKWLALQGILPGYIACSPAARASETASLVCSGGGLSPGVIHHDERLYLASRGELLTVIRGLSGAPDPIMVVGHNPGLEELLLYLAGDAALDLQHRKILPTATIAHMKVPADLAALAPESAELLGVIRPRDLPD